MTMYRWWPSTLCEDINRAYIFFKPGCLSVKDSDFLKPHFAAILIQSSQRLHEAGM